MRNVIIVLASLLLGAIIYGFFLPSAWHVEKSLQIRAPKEKILPLITQLQRWPEWAMPADLKPEEATATTLKWVGGGHIEVTEATDTSIAYDLRYSDKEQPTKGKLTLKDDTVIWTDDGSMGSNPIARYFIKSVVRDVSNDMELGLARLKQRAETP